MLFEFCSLFTDTEFCTYVTISLEPIENHGKENVNFKFLHVTNDMEKYDFVMCFEGEDSVITSSTSRGNTDPLIRIQFAFCY